MKRYLKQCTFLGQPDSRALDGFAGFYVGQIYLLRYRRGDKGIVVIELDHLQGGGQLAVTAGEFEAWFTK